MKNYSTKLKYVFPTFLLITVITVSSLLLVRYVFCIRFDILNVTEKNWEIFIPIFFPWLPNLLFLRQKLRVLHFKKDSEKGRFYFQIISWVTMMAMLSISQKYLTTASGKIQTLSDVEEINKVEKTRYYKIKDFVVIPHRGGPYTQSYVSGKRDNYLNFRFFYVMAILKNKSFILEGNPKCWLGVKFEEQIDNKISEAEKSKKFTAFYNACAEKIESSDFSETDHFERIPASDDKEDFFKAIGKAIHGPVDESFIVLTAINEKYEDRNGDKLAWTFGVFGIGNLIFLVLLIVPSYSNNEEKNRLKY